MAKKIAKKSTQKATKKTVKKAVKKAVKKVAKKATKKAASKSPQKATDAKALWLVERDQRLEFYRSKSREIDTQSSSGVPKATLSPRTTRRHLFQR